MTPLSLPVLHGERQYSAEHDNRELAIVLCVILAEIERCGGEAS